MGEKQAWRRWGAAVAQERSKRGVSGRHRPSMRRDESPSEGNREKITPPKTPPTPCNAMFRKVQFVHSSLRENPTQITPPYTSDPYHPAAMSLKSETVQLLMLSVLRPITNKAAPPTEFEFR